MIRRFAGAVAGLWLALAPAAAQQGGGTATLRGVVFDSLLTGRPLMGAEVWLEGTPHHALTDALGRFAFEELAAGTYRVGFAHATFDSVGFSFGLRPVTLTAQGAVVMLGPPSAAALHARVCGPATETGLLLGGVTRAADGAAAPGVTVRAEWTETTIAIGRRGGGNTVASVEDVSDAMGRYHLCGVPRDVAVAVRAQAPDMAGGPIAVELDGRAFGVQHLTVAGTGDTTLARIAGYVRRVTGEPIAEATVVLIGDSARARTGDDGRYTLALHGRGSRTIEVRAIGFQRRRVIVAVGRAGATMDVALTAVVTQLPDLVALSDRTGYEQRRRAGLGQFITAADIERMRPERTEDAIRLVTKALFPGGFARPNMVLLKGGQCSPRLFIDGSPVRTPADDSGGRRGTDTRTGAELLHRRPGQSLATPTSPTVTYTEPLRVDPDQVRGIEIYDASQRPPNAIVQSLAFPLDSLVQTRCFVFIWTWKTAPVAGR